MSASFNPELAKSDFLRLAAFAPQVGTGFEVRRGPERVSLELTQAKAGAGHRPEVGEKFALIFTGGLEKPLQQGVHEFEHVELGAFELFITPVMCPHQDVRWYEAVINREIGH